MKAGRSWKRRSGFTLIEVLMVAAILALLAAFAIPALMRQGEKARADICRASVGRNGPIAGSLNNYRFDVGTYPSTDEGLMALYEIPRSVDEDDKLWQGPYMEGPYEELRDPWNQEYQYKSPGEFNEDGYDLWSVGKDRREGTEDDIKNGLEK